MSTNDVLFGFGSGGKGGGKAQVAEFRLSVHFGICHGPIDSINALYFGEKKAWGVAAAQAGGPLQTPTAAVDPLTESKALRIVQYDLFGGPAKEGGVGGYVYFLPGHDTQVLPEGLAARLNLTSETAPGYRGIASVWLTSASGARTRTHGEVVSYEQADADDDPFGSTHNRQHGFAWQHNVPYIKTFWANATDIPKTLDPDTATIEDETAGPQANPGHIIYECYTNTDWGSGESPLSIKIESFQQAATTLFNEKFGLSMLWERQTEIEEFIRDVLTHIQGVVFVNPRDGLITLKLLRGDYDEEYLLEFDETNSRLIGFERSLIGESINAVQVKWMNPADEEDASVTLQDLGAVTSQGGVVVQTTRSYLGIRNVNLATQVCQRDLRAAAAPLAAAELICDRSAWDITPGSVIKVFSQEHCLSGAIFRVIEVDPGKVGDPEIKLKILEDIFSFSGAQFTAAPTTQWQNPATTPTAPTNTQIITLPPLIVLPQILGGVAVPDTFTGVFATHDSENVQSFELITRITNLNGTQEFVSTTGVYPMVGRTTLSSFLAPESETLEVAFTNPVSGIIGPAENRFVLIGEGGDEDMEIAFIPSMAGKSANLYRGALDTVPREWPEGTPVWFFGTDTTFVDPAVRTDAVEMMVKVAPISSLSKLVESEAPEIVFTPTSRPHLPARPADVQINEVGFPQSHIDLIGDSMVEITWATRNRLLEETIVLKWTEPSIAPEEGQFTLLETFTPDGQLIVRHDDLSGTSYVLTPEDTADHPVVLVRLKSIMHTEDDRDEMESLQGHELGIRLEEGGWGYSWGLNWGGGGAGGTPALSPLIATLRSSATSGADLAVYNFSSMSLGPATADRLIAVGVFGRDASATNIDISAVLVGDIELTNSTRVVGNTGGANPQTISAIYWGRVPAGAAADITVAFNLSVIRCGIAVYAIPGASEVAFDTATANNNNTMGPTLDVAEDGAIVAISGLGSDGTETATWTGATETLDSQVGGEGSNFSSAAESDLTAEIGRAVQVVWTAGTNDDQSLVVVSFSR